MVRRQMQIETVTGYVFRPDHLRVDARKPGISAFMRIRNGADFVEATIRSHVEFYDEIVAVHNQCQDDTPAILARLAQEFAPRIRVFHYTDRVQPLGSKAHAETPGDSPESMVNYSNFALARTRHQWAVKLDDDHLAIPSAVRRVCDDLRAGRLDEGTLHCFSGVNLARNKMGRLAIPAVDPVSGGGDIGYFRVTPATRFYHDPRFERFGRAGLDRRFVGYLYWHLKFLKSGEGFVNYELDDNPDSRFARKQARFRNSWLMSLPEARAALAPGPMARLATLFSAKNRLLIERATALAPSFPDDALEDALDRVSPGWRDIARLGPRYDAPHSRGPADD